MRFEPSCYRRDVQMFHRDLHREILELCSRSGEPDIIPQQKHAAYRHACAFIAIGKRMIADDISRVDRRLLVYVWVLFGAKHLLPRCLNDRFYPALISYAV